MSVSRTKKKTYLHFASVKTFHSGFSFILILFLIPQLSATFLIHSDSHTRTFDIELCVDDVAHDGGVVQVFDSVFGPPGAGEEDTRQTQVLAGLGVEQDLHFLHLAEFSAHL